MKKIICHFLCLAVFLSMFSFSASAASSLNKQERSTEIAMRKINDYVKSLDIQEIQNTGELADFTLPVVSEDGSLFAMPVYALDTTNLLEAYSLNRTIDENAITYVACMENMTMVAASSSWSDVDWDPTVSSKFFMTVFYERIPWHPMYPEFNGIKITSVQGSSSLDPGVQIMNNSSLVIGCSTPYAGIQQKNEYLNFRQTSFNYSTGFSQYAIDNSSSVIGAGWTIFVKVRNVEYKVPFQTYMHGP